MGADKSQTLKAIAEAEAYQGPSLIIAYSPCINHGLRLIAITRNVKPAGKIRFILDSKEPTMAFREFLMGEVRYSSLKKQFPEQAEALFAKTEADAKDKLATYKRMADQK
jgi:pyruvate-ferredoxin/flavodoxin oxidoreductase